MYDIANIKVKIYTLYAVIICIFASSQFRDGFTVLEITTQDSDKSQKICNLNWQVTDNVTQIIIPEKTPESNDDCYCMIYHPLYQSELDNLILDIDHTDINEPGNTFEDWIELKQISWYTSQFKIPVFRIQNASFSSPHINLFLITTHGTELEAYLPVRMTFKEIARNRAIRYQEPLHLSCNPSGYVLPDILIAIPARSMDNDKAKTTVNTAAVEGVVCTLLLFVIILTVILCSLKKRIVAKEPSDPHTYCNTGVSESPNGYEIPVGRSPPSTAPVHTYENNEFQSDPNRNPYTISGNAQEVAHATEYEKLDPHPPTAANYDGPPYSRLDRGGGDYENPDVTSTLTV